MKKMLNKKENSGITLVALVITIILLLIVAGISIANIGGENSLIKRSKQAKKEQELAQAQEALSTELANILIDNDGKKDLKKLENLKVDGYTTKVSDVARLVTMTKDGEIYNFLVDSNYNIQNIDSIENNKNNESGDNQNSSSCSDIINDFNIKLESQTGLSAKINIDGSVNTKDGSNILGYIVLVDGKGKEVINKMPYTINFDKVNTTYKITVIAIDIYGKTKSSNADLSVKTPDMKVEILNYPIMTTKGMVNIKYVNPNNTNDYYYALDLSKDCTAEDALDKSAYDGDKTTYYDGTSAKNKFYFGNDIDIYQVCLLIDSSYNVSSNSVFKYVNKPSSYISVGNGKFIEPGLFHTTYYGKGSTNWRGWLSQMTCKLYEIYYNGNLQ